MPPLDPDECYAAASSRDARFDGRFVLAVRTTGIYCRPSCPALTPKRSNVEFHRTAAAAQQRGFRACKRCLPDATPGSPEWDVRHDVVARAMRLIADGVVERDGVGGVAARLGYSPRHLDRLLSEEVGAGPLAIARAQRAQTARILIETTALTLTEVAFAAGFGSVRQFNDTIREVFEATPTALRTAARARRGASEPRAASPGDPAGCAPAVVTLRLAVRAPFDGAHAVGFSARRAVPGLEVADPSPPAGAADDGRGGRPRFARLLSLAGGPAVAVLEAADDHVVASLRLTRWADVTSAVARLRRLLDLDADPVAVDAHLGADPVLGPLVRAAPGRRSPGGVDVFEVLVRAIVGQQVSVDGARTVTARMVEAAGEAAPGALVAGVDGLTTTFPSAERLADLDDDALRVPAARRATIRRVAELVASGELALHPGADPDEVRARLLAVPGIGPWTADHVALRGLGRPDVLLVGDLVVRRALRRAGVDEASARRWSPWRSYATHHLWAASHDPAAPAGARRRGDRPSRTRPPATARRERS